MHGHWHASHYVKEIDAHFRATGTVIIPFTVKDILEEPLARKLA